tara:strand:+ start:377 stop:613 length:237 start_codon:yes stop_codon:yes gene_type:complete
MVGRYAGAIASSFDDALLPLAAVMALKYEQDKRSKKVKTPPNIDPRSIMQAQLNRRSINPYANPPALNISNQIYGTML